MNGMGDALVANNPLQGEGAQPQEEHDQKKTTAMRQQMFVGGRIEVLFTEDKIYYPGTIVRFDVERGTHFVEYDDGDTEDLIYDDLKHEFRDKDGDKVEMRWHLNPALRGEKWIQVQSPNNFTEEGECFGGLHKGVLADSSKVIDFRWIGQKQSQVVVVVDSMINNITEEKKEDEKDRNEPPLEESDLPPSSAPPAADLHANGLSELTQEVEVEPKQEPKEGVAVESQPNAGNLMKSQQLKSSLVGKRIETIFTGEDGEESFFSGTIASFDAEQGAHFVEYDDGEKEYLVYDECTHQFRDLKEGENVKFRWQWDPRLRKNKWIEVRLFDSTEGGLVAQIQDVDKKSGKAEVRYEHDGSIDVLDLQNIEVSCKLIDRRGVVPKEKREAKKKEREREKDPLLEGSTKAKAKARKEVVLHKVDPVLIHRRIEVLFDNPPEYFAGTLESFNEKTGMYSIAYDDGTKDQLLYSGVERNEFIDKKGEKLKYRWELEPRLRKNKWIEVLWMDPETQEQEYYAAQIHNLNKKSGQAEIQYEHDGYVEVIDLRDSEFKYRISDRPAKPRPNEVKKEAHSTEILLEASTSSGRVKQLPSKSTPANDEDYSPAFVPSPSEIVWVRQPNYGYWPAEVLDPASLGEEQMRERSAKFANSQICALFFDGATRSFCWAPLRDVLPFEEHFVKLSKKNKKNKVFSLGVEQARQEFEEKREAEAFLNLKVKGSKSPFASPKKRAKKGKKKSTKDLLEGESNQKKRKFLNLNSSTDEELSMALIKKLSHGLRAQKTEQVGAKPGTSSIDVIQREAEPPKAEVFLELPLDQFQTWDVVWGKTKGCPFWPAVIYDYEDLPPQVRRMRKNDTLPVMYLGPCSKSKGKGGNKDESRDWGWVGKGSILPFASNLDAFGAQRITKAHKMSSYILAIEEAQKWERGELLEGFVETDPNAAGVPAEAFDASATVGNKEKTFSGPQCKSCGSLVKEGKFLQTRDWTELCRPCKRAYDNGDFCKVCEALYLPTEKEMVCCDSCNGWIHGKCDPEASKVLQQVAANPEGEVAYLCILCREIFSKQGLERKPGTAGFILQHKGKSSLLDQAKQLFAVDFLNDARRKKSWVRSVKEEAKAVNTAWAQLTADGQQEYIARVAPKPANKRKPSDKDKSAAGNQGNLNPKDAAIVAKPKKVPDGPWQKVHQKKFVPVKARWAKDYCSICDLGHDYEFDQFLTCTSCGITVHQSCYGVQELPALDDVWLCRACEKHEKGKKRPQCCVCPVEGGALKPTTLAGYWCHVACMQWLPEITVVDVDRMEPIDRITKINKQRWEKKCSLCKQDTGAIIQCDSCYTAFHPLCARMAGCEMVTEEDKNGNIFFKAFCPRHSSKLNLGRTGLVSATSEVEIEGEKRLVDPSQYVFHITLPPMDIHCATGCGRCEPLHSSLGWQRENKGSGRGISSTKGFWIPQPLEAPAPPAESSKAKKTPVKSVSRKRNAQPATYSKYWPKSPIPLEPLPEGCPERVRVNCGSVHGFFTVRSQTILYEGQEIAASKFEALGGKGSTKKWKLSLWACDENRTRVMQMNDWLNGFGFTKAYLFSLKMNTSNIEKYTEWKNSQEGSDQVEVETVLTRVINEVMLKSSSPSNGNNAVQNDGDDQKVTSLEEPTSSLPPSTPTPVAAGLVSQGQNNHIDRDTDPALDNGNGSEKVVKEVVRKAFENVIHSEKNALVRNQFGTAAVGETVKIFLSEVNTWCEARILRYSEKHGMHKVEHRYGSNEWLSLLFHERITWDNKISEPPKVQSPPSPGLSSQEDKDKDPFLQKKFLSECVGKRVGIWWKDDGCFYYGQIREYDPAREANAGKCWQIMYDDGVEEWLDLKQERVEWNQPPVVGALGKMPSVAVTCNGLKGYFMTMSNQIHVFGVYGVPLETFVEFAGLRGKGSSWKVAIRILKKDNSPGQTIGDWLFEHGLEQKSYSPSKENKMKRRNHHEGHTRRVRVDVKRQRCGKQAFVRGLAYRVKFSRKREEVPDHKSWSGKDWLAKFKTNDSPFPSAAVDGGAATAEGGGPDAKKDNGEENAVLTAVVDAAVDPAVEAVMDAILKMVVESAEQGYDSSAAENTLLSNKPAVESTPACAQIPSGPEGIISSLMHELVWQTERKAEMGLISSTGLMGQEVHLNEHSADGVRETGRVVGLGESAIKIERKDKNVIEVPFGDDLIWWHTLMNVNRRPKHVKQFFRKKGELISDQAGATGAASSLPPGSNDCYPVALGVYCVGWGVSLLWPDNNMYYYGVVDDYNYLDDKHRILYDDGNYEWLHLIEEEIKWLKRPDLIKKRKDDIPDEVRVASNGIEGIFHVHIRKIAVAKKMLKVMRFVSNTMFASNEHKNKKVQELLQESEEDPKPSKVKSARLREKAKGQLPVDPPSSTSSAAATGEEEDKEIALLVKEMMRLAFSKVLGEEVGGGSATNNTEKDTITEDSEFVSIDEFTWLARKFNSRSSVKKVRVLEADGSEGKYTLLQWLRVQGLEAPPKARKLGVGGSNTNNGKEQKAKKKRKRKKVRFTQPEERESFDVIPLIDRIKKCSQEEHKKVTFGKSVIHGWGLFAKVAIKEGETVVEYRGDIVRHSVANEREISYREQKKDLYLFTANDHQVIDGTDCGSIGRFMNHSCAPSTYIKFAEDAETGLPHLVFLARCDILPGQELTFDYRLKEEGEDHKILCMCGAPTCKGTMN